MKIFDGDQEGPDARKSYIVGRAGHAIGRLLLWGCVLLLLIRGIASEFQTPPTVTTTRGVPTSLHQPTAPTATTEGE